MFYIFAGHDGTVLTNSSKKQYSLQNETYNEIACEIYELQLKGYVHITPFLAAVPGFRAELTEKGHKHVNRN